MRKISNTAIVAVSLGLSANRNDLFRLLVDSWVKSLKSPKTNAKPVETYYLLVKEKFEELQKMIFFAIGRKAEMKVWHYLKSQA